ncbi:hypothetical protein KQH49_10605 [Mycetohabitans sp. B5]|uniref:CBS domain-containing protein n=1 Tax=Mycetohabitans endofungorum TaxID=417203 RepID=A0A2P5K881_9BURK|nr:hypothetical protein [Mycetohabitans sp. B5]PPB82921.1 hypothetical protein B0O95_11298 [Mycetohabitans endofungorum]
MMRFSAFHRLWIITAARHSAASWNILGSSPLPAARIGAARSSHANKAALRLERLAVVDDPHSRRLLGLVRRSDLLKLSLALFDEELRRQRFRRPPLRFMPHPRRGREARPR